MKPIDYDSAGQWPRSLRDAAFSRVSLVAATVCSLLVIAGAGATGLYLDVSPVVVMLVALAAIVISSALLVLSLRGKPREQRSVSLRTWTLCLPLCASPCLLIVVTVAPMMQTLAALGWSGGGLLLLAVLAFAASLVSAAGPLLVWLILHGFLTQQLKPANASAQHRRSAVIAALTMTIASVALGCYQLVVAMGPPPGYWQ